MALAEHLAVLRGLSGRCPVLVLVEPRTARVDAQLIPHIRPFGKACLGLAPATAIVGLGAAGRLVFVAITTACHAPARAFHDVPRALDWLVDRIT